MVKSFLIETSSRETRCNRKRSILPPSDPGSDRKTWKARQTFKMTSATLKPWLLLGFPLALMVLYTSSKGVLQPEIYRLEAPIYAAQGVGQDYANLLLVLPSYVSSWWFTWKGSMRALLVQFGILSYLVYSYAMYAITVHFNSLFLAYTACFGLSLYSMIGLLVNVDTEALCSSLERSLRRSKVRISLSVWLTIMACMFYTMWLSEIVPHMMAGTVPPSIVETGLPSNLVHVLDLGVMLPLTLLTASWIFQERHTGFLFAPLLLSFSVCMMAALAFMIVSMYMTGHVASLMPALIFVILFLVNLMFDVLYLKLLPDDKILLRATKGKMKKINTM